MTVRRALLALIALLLVGAAPAAAVTSHEGWPKRYSLFMNKLDGNRPLDARPGFDPFGGQDPKYSCDGIHGTSDSCGTRFVPGTETQYVMTDERGHHRLLGGHGNDLIHAARWGDVIWGDYKPSGQPESQVDHLFGGRGDDFVYGSHGTNHIAAGSGDDYVKTHWGRGTVNCGGGNDKLYISRRARPGYRIRNCETISHRTLGY